MSFKERIVRSLRRFGNQSPEVIIAGNQKSGTTAIAKLLAHATGKTLQNDIPALWPPHVYEFLQLKRPISHFLRTNPSSFSAEIVKEPNLTFFLPELVAIFPETRFVFVVRDPRDNIRSILNRRGVPGNLEQLTDSIMSTQERSYIGNPHIWKSEDGHYVSQQALKWNACVDAYERVKTGIILIRYEDFKSDKINQIGQLAQRLGLYCKYSIANIMDVPFQPRGDSSVSWEKFFGMANLKRINDICQVNMNKFGYHVAR